MRHSPLPPFLLGDLEHPHIREYPPLHKLHDVEVCPHDALVFAQAVHLRYGHSIGVLIAVSSALAYVQALVVRIEAREDAVLALDGVRRGREEVARGLLPEDVPRGRRVREDVRRVRLPEAELLDLDGARDGGDVGCEASGDRSGRACNVRAWQRRRAPCRPSLTLNVSIQRINVNCLPDLAKLLADLLLLLALRCHCLA